MWEYIYKFFEYAPLYVGLVLVPALIRTVIDTAVIRITPSAFDLPPSKHDSLLSVKYEDAFSSLVGTALYAPLVEEIVFRGSAYLMFGIVGLVIGNAVWVLAHPSWQLRYVSGLPLKKKLAFTANASFYYICAAIFFSIPWLQGFGILSVVYHMLHNGMLVLGGIFHEIELPAPWKKEEAEYFTESRGLKKKLEKRFFKDTTQDVSIEDLDEFDVDVDEVDLDRKFFKELKKSITKSEKSKEQKAEVAKMAAARVSDDWFFWN